MTNSQFAKQMACHHTMASRYRNGLRLPSVDAMRRMSTEFDLPLDELMAAHAGGRSAFGAYLRKKVFDVKPVPPSPQAEQVA